MGTTSKTDTCDGVQGSDGTWSSQFAAAMTGSPTLYSDPAPPEEDWWANNGGRRWKGNRSPLASINFITAHDGFTLADLVSFNEKHNEANGEQNRYPSREVQESSAGIICKFFLHLAACALGASEGVAQPASQMHACNFIS